VIAANEAKSAFLAHMSHEIRTPLSAIIGFSELIVGDNLPRQDKSTYLSAMRRNSKALSRIIADILDLSKVEAGSIELELKDVDLRAVVRDIETMFRPRAREKGIDFEIRLSEHIPLQINTDPARLFQILANLIGNALKFTEHGRIELSIFMTQVEGGERLIFDVTDTGLGMTEVEAKDLFKPFVRSITAQKRGFRGTGLGLVLSRRLAQALGGDVTLQQSKAGVGSTFSLWLHSQGPQDSQEAAAQEVLSMPSPSNEGLAGVSVLLAEDSFDIQLLIQTLLSKSGATVDTANNGIEAVEKASRKTYDVILMDLQMPEMDGYQAVKILRSRAYPGSIIALSAHAMKEEELRSIESGFDAHQCKPFDRQRLIAIVAQYSKMP
jgi:CheY-like chemotaxis protein/two-component sensor histidine kinase